MRHAKYGSKRPARDQAAGVLSQYLHTHPFGSAEKVVDAIIEAVIEELDRRAAADDEGATKSEGDGEPPAG